MRIGYFVTSINIVFFISCDYGGASALMHALTYSCVFSVLVINVHMLLCM